MKRIETILEHVSEAKKDAEPKVLRVIFVPNGISAVDYDTNPQKHPGPCMVVHHGTQGRKREWLPDVPAVVKFLRKTKAPKSFIAELLVTEGLPGYVAPKPEPAAEPEPEKAPKAGKKDGK